MASPWPLADRPDGCAIERRRALLHAEAVGDATTVAHALVDVDDRVRASAIVIALRTDAVPIESIVACATDTSPRVRRSVAEVGATTPAIDLAPLLGDDDTGVVETACWAAGERGPAGAVYLDALISICTAAPDPLCREAAAAALGAIGDYRGLPAILAAMGDRATVRRRAVLALAPFDTPEVDAALDAALHDRDWQVRQAAEDLR